MISVAKLKKMMNAELASDAWWDGLSKKEQQAYIKAHPKSKYAKQGVTKKTTRDVHHEKPIHSGPSNIATSNFLVKNFGAKRLKNMGRNPYANHQVMQHILSASGAKKMHDHLLSNGWNVDEAPAKDGLTRTKVVGTERKYKHPDGGEIYYEHTLGEHTHNGKDYHGVSIWAAKKAKPVNLPIYD
jgi:hypothetical protein